jgi:exopolysaccharide production protein ExoZ
MRLFAAFGVFQYHLWNNYLSVPFLHSGTDFFFVLVGFVAAVSQSRHIATGGWWNYIWGRYLRLYVTFIPVFILYILAGRDPLSPEYVLKSFFLIPIHDQLPLVGPTWMLSLFLVFYWLFSLAFLFRNEKVLFPVFTVWAAGCIFFTWFDWKPAFASDWFQIIFDIRNVEFIFGYLAGKLIITGRVSYLTAAWSIPIGIITLIASSVWYNAITHDMEGAGRIFLYGLPLTLIALGLAGLEQHEVKNPVVRVVTHPWLVWLGNVSYVLFLIHNVVIRVWDTVIPITPLQVPLIIIVVFIAAGLGYQFWEKPMLGYLRQRTLPSKRDSSL